MRYEIKAICEADIGGFSNALSSVVAERKFLLTLAPTNLDDVTNFVQANINNNYAQYVARYQGEIVGWADIIPHHKEALRHAGVLGMGVIAVHRGKGIGKQLLQQVLEHAWHSGLTRVELEVFASNVNAIGLYRKCGFEHEGTKRNGRLIDGIYCDVHFMAQCR